MKRRKLKDDYEITKLIDEIDLNDDFLDDFDTEEADSDSNESSIQSDDEDKLELDVEKDDSINESNTASKNLWHDRPSANRDRFQFIGDAGVCEKLQDITSLTNIFEACINEDILNVIVDETIIKL